MKKIISIILSFVLAMSMTTTAFANPVTNNGTTNTNITVKGTYVAGAATANVVSVGIAWGAMTFTYTDNSYYWDPTDHNSEISTAASWSASGNNITVTNHSNVGITAGLSFAGTGNVNGKFYDAQTGGNEKTSLSIARAAEDSALTSQQSTVYFRITTGTINASTNNLGTITVKIARQS